MEKISYRNEPALPGIFIILFGIMLIASFVIGYLYSIVYGVILFIFSFIMLAISKTLSYLDDISYNLKFIKENKL